jgi:hypothetical protein
MLLGVPGNRGIAVGSVYQALSSDWRRVTANGVVPDAPLLFGITEWVRMREASGQVVSAVCALRKNSLDDKISDVSDS